MATLPFNPKSTIVPRGRRTKYLCPKISDVAEIISRDFGAYGAAITTAFAFEMRSRCGNSAPYRTEKAKLNAMALLRDGADE
jgi:hypothetical protein